MQHDLHVDDVGSELQSTKMITQVAVGSTIDHLRITLVY